MAKTANLTFRVDVRADRGPAVTQPTYSRDTLDDIPQSVSYTIVSERSAMASLVRWEVSSRSIWARVIKIVA